MIGYEGAPRYTRLIEALTGDTEIVPPGIVLEADRPEWALLKRERLWICAFNLAALAANFNLFALAMPNADTVSIITYLWTDQTSRYGFVTQAGMAAGAGVTGGIRFRDNRRSGRPNTAQFTKQNAAQQLAGTNYVGFSLANAVQDQLPPFVLATTGATGSLLFVVEAVTANVNQNVVLAGYEREMRREEVEQ